MDGKHFFEQCCSECGIECDKFFKLGASAMLMPDRFYHKFNRNTMKETQLFAVCYFEVDNLYIAWNLHDDKKAGTSKFSIKRSDLNLPMSNNIQTIRKTIEHHGHGEETVIAFAPETVPVFLEQYIPKG